MNTNKLHSALQPLRGRSRLLAVLAVIAVLGAGTLWAVGKPQSAKDPAPPAAAKPAGAARPALTVTTTTPQLMEWARTLSANGNVTPWQEAIIGAELQGQRLTEVLADVGSVVQKGQVLARLPSETVTAALA